MTYRFTIKGRLEGLNEYINACRTNPHKGNKMKRDAEDYVSWPIRTQLKGVRIRKPVIIKFDFFEANKRRDLDNISGFAHKVIQDALVKCGVLKNDGWNEVIRHMDQFYIDKKNPRIEVTIVEVGD
jgi:Holliday junction resolvase RusA-like endonuclease